MKIIKVKTKLRVESFGYIERKITGRCANLSLMTKQSSLSL